MKKTPSYRFRQAVQNNQPLQIVGTINAYCALLAEKQGHQAIYLSGAGVANASYGLPDLGITCLSDVLEDVRRISSATECPLLVDIDTGWGDVFSIARTIKEMERAGAAAVHIEDQVAEKRCGHRPNKSIVSKEKMQDRIKASVDARRDDQFVIMARTDALAVEGMASAIERACLCVEAGADMIFPEAMTSLEDYRFFTQSVNVPVLANITEFSTKTPLFDCNELADAGIAMVLYPLSAFRAMSKAAESVYQSIAVNGHQKNVLNIMQTREELYQRLGYYDYEKKRDKLSSD
ncbi:MAG: methylisocitrate lyase [Endozoicomonas sp. (ex Botrylloides leachii)]|nr:methylisocitrate lyase [Endozoicomonas sp. (ex Botrylloides leachii)]